MDKLHETAAFIDRETLVLWAMCLGGLAAVMKEPHELGNLVLSRQRTAEAVEMLNLIADQMMKSAGVVQRSLEENDEQEMAPQGLHEVRRRRDGDE